MPVEELRADLDAALRRVDEVAGPTRSDLEVEIITLRHDAAVRLIADAGSAQPVPPSSVELPSTFPPAVSPAELDAAKLAAGLREVGCLHVPGLVDDDRIAELVDGIDRAFAGYDEWAADGSPSRWHPDDAGPWFRPFIPGAGDIHTTRPWLRRGGGVFTADSPRVHRLWVEFLEASGVLQAVTEFFGEPPVTSLDKATLRRVQHGDGIEWHQDGSFIGPEAGAINMWLTLSDTTDAPGLELVAGRLDRIAETGTAGAGYDWSTGPGVVAEVAEDVGVVAPRFGAGDALFFDGMLLHRTELRDPPPPATRYAIETWFFRPSRFPRQQELPLVL